MTSEYIPNARIPNVKYFTEGEWDLTKQLTCSASKSCPKPARLFNFKPSDKKEADWMAIWACEAHQIKHMTWIVFTGYKTRLLKRNI